MGILLCGIILLSLGDFALTATHLKMTGMVEANPIAAFVIRETRSLWALALYKGSTVALCVLLLFHLRKRFQGELAAWLATIILVLMCLQWRAYRAELENADEVQIVRSLSRDEHWLQLE